MTAKNCGAFIAKLRKRKNLTQKQLAEAINVTDKAVSRWETGKGFPDVTSLVALSNFLEVSVNELLAGEKIPYEKITEVADSNLINAISKTEKAKKNNITQIIICILVFTSIFCPMIFLTGKEFIAQFKLYVSDENISDCIIMMVICFFMLISGFLISKGHISLLHSYHYRNVTDRKGYCAAMGKATMILGVPFLVSGIMILFSSVHIVEVLSTAILMFGSAVVFIWIFKIQIKYNGGIF